MTHFRRDLYSGRVVVITGGATGIGFGMAREFGLHGAHVVLASRNEERLEAARNRLEGLGVSCAVVRCDVRDEDAVARMVEETFTESGGIDVLVNNAAGNFYSPAETMSSRSFRTVIDIDLLGTFLCTRAVVPHMIEQRAGAVLNIVMTDPHRGSAHFSHAAAAKSGVLALTTSWAREWGRYNIRVNALAPGPTPSKAAVNNMAVGRPGVPPSFEKHRGRIPLGRLGEPQDSAFAALFLCSDAASYITGVNLAVDGGISLPVMTTETEDLATE